MAIWDEVVVRARGLSTHLLTSAELDSLARADNLSALVRRLPRELQVTPTPAALEASAQRAAARDIATLHRHAGARRARALAALNEDEERRAVRHLLRGALQGAPRQARLAGLLPTAHLSRTALERLADAPDDHAVATRLVALQHPYGLDMLEPTRPVRPDPLAIELALDRVYARRATRAARRGDAILRSYVARTLDFDNAMAAIALATAPSALDYESTYLQGGRSLSREDYVTAASQGDPESARRHVLTHVDDPIVERALENAEDPRDAFLRAQIDALSHERRIAPLSTAPVIWFVLRSRLQHQSLQRIIWGVALAAPAAVVRPHRGGSS